MGHQRSKIIYEIYKIKIKENTGKLKINSLEDLYWNRKIVEISMEV